MDTTTYITDVRIHLPYPSVSVSETTDYFTTTDGKVTIHKRDTIQRIYYPQEDLDISVESEEVQSIINHYFSTL